MNDSTDNFDNAFEKLILNEGGFSDDPYDAGGATIYGITSRDYPDTYRVVLELYRMGNKELALDAAKRFYRKEFWNELYQGIPDSSLTFKIFDLSVNTGKKTAVKMLQTAIAKFDKFIKIDGIFGQKTLMAIQNIESEKLYVEYILVAESRYRKLKTAWRYLRGWTIRLKKRFEI